VELIPHQVKKAAVNLHNPPTPAIWVPGGRTLMDAHAGQDTTPAVTLSLPSERSLADACAGTPDRPQDAARAAGRARRRVTGLALAAAGYAAACAAVTASGPLSRGAAVQVLFAATMLVCALGETLLSPAAPPVTGDQARPGAAGRRKRLGTCALAAGCLLGPSAGGAALGAGWTTSVLTTLAVACAVAGIAAGRPAGRHPAPAVSRSWPRTTQRAGVPARTSKYATAGRAIRNGH
jgi:hypothetical protein